MNVLWLKLYWSNYEKDMFEDNCVWYQYIVIILDDVTKNFLSYL